MADTNEWDPKCNMWRRAQYRYSCSSKYTEVLLRFLEH
jgi:hypothetical protein